jgi:spore maturation protein CgeB
MVFIANPTPHRRDILRGITSPVALYGPGWTAQDSRMGHEIGGGRIAAKQVSTILAKHQAALNIQNEFNVISGLNQRNFQPCLAGATLITDDQPDVARCFTPGAEVLVFRSADEASALYDRVRGDVGFGAAVARQGHDRVLAHHTFAHRLKAICAAVGLPSS